MIGTTGEPVLSVRVGRADIPLIRRRLADHAAAAGLDGRQREDLVLVIDEILTNAVRHGGGAGYLELWVGAGRVAFRVVDQGPGMDTAVEPTRPAPNQAGGRGLWLAHQLADEITISSGPDGTAVVGAIGATAT